MEQNSQKLTAEDVYHKAVRISAQIEAEVQGDRNLSELLLQQISWIQRTSFIISEGTSRPGLLPPHS